MNQLFNPMPENLEEANAHLAANPAGVPLTGDEFATSLPPSRSSIPANQLDTATINQQILDETVNQEKATKKIPKETKNPKDFLEQLISFGEYKGEVEVMGAKWTMRALEQGDYLQAFDDVKDDLTSQAGRVTTLMFAQVVFAIEALNGI